MLQIFTYSTGLALTGRSAACAPATATRPAAVPRRRLFTIFIVTSNYVPWEGPTPPGARCPMEGPPTFPAPPEWPFASSVFQPPDAPDTPDGATGRCPPPSHHHISSRGSTGNEEQAESQVLRYVFKKVLHKWHEFVLRSGLRRVVPARKFIE